MLIDETVGQIRTVIVDDEPLARSNITVLLRRHPEVEIVKECGSGAEALAEIRRSKPDLVFLDVEMPECDGFDVLELLGADIPPAIIFVTAYDQYALQAFDVHALDYLLKPIDSGRFVEAVGRAQRQIELHLGNSLEDRLRLLLAEHPAYVQRLAIRTGRRIAFVLVDEIDWIEAAGDYATLHVGKKSPLLRETFNSLETRLDPSRFVRIHRSTIVQVSRIRDLQSLPNRELRLTLIDGTELKVSRSYRDRLDRWLSKEAAVS